MTTEGRTLLWGFLMVLGFFFDWTPTIVAVIRKMPNVGSIVVINFFLGWTCIGWVVTLAMAGGAAVASLRQSGASTSRWRGSPRHPKLVSHVEVVRSQRHTNRLVPTLPIDCLDDAELH